MATTMTVLGEGFVGSTSRILRAHPRPIGQGELERLENLEGTTSVTFTFVKILVDFSFNIFPSFRFFYAFLCLRSFC
jgi:hypothetical protein